LVLLDRGINPVHKMSSRIISKSMDALKGTDALNPSRRDGSANRRKGADGSDPLAAWR
jgi:hypothetical protein